MPTEPATTPGAHAPRNEGDRYLTPDALARAITKTLADLIEPPSLIVEPSAGEGAFVRAARGAWVGVPVYAIEPNAEANQLHFTAPGEVSSTTWEDATWPPYCLDSSGPTLILGNPPFNLAESHVRLGLERLGHFDAKEPEPRYLVFLMRQSFWGPARLALRIEAPLYARYSIGPRPSFTLDGQSDGAEYDLFVWKVGHRGSCIEGNIKWTRDPLTPEQKQARKVAREEKKERTRLSRVKRGLEAASMNELLDEFIRREEEEA